MKKIALALVPLLALSGCGGGPAKAPADKTLTVLAAASLTSTFTELADRFEADHPGVRVKLVLGSSATLAQSAVDGAPGDVLATADEQTMNTAVKGGAVGDAPYEFATNELMLAVPADNPAGIEAFADLDRDGVDYVTCVRTAPCGAAAGRFLAGLHVDRKPVSEEVDVKAVLAKVVAGEADAGIVYKTDVTAAGKDVLGITVPHAAEVPNEYWVTLTAHADQPALAKAWIQLLRGKVGRGILRDAGFGAPTQ